jgi:hypothetical protein
MALAVATACGCFLKTGANGADARRADSQEEMIVFSLAGGFPVAADRLIDPEIVHQPPPTSGDPVDPHMAIGPNTLHDGRAGAGETLHGWTVLGRTAVTSPAARRRIHEAIREGIRNHDGSVAACFDPHHTIRVTRNGKTTDMVICFMCSQIYVYEDDRKTETILVSTTPRPVLNDVLRGAGVPLAKAAEGK